MFNILLVEDEPMISEPFKIILSAEKDMVVDVAANGLQALEYFAKKHYDVILLDLMMPVCDGVGFLRQAQPATTAPTTRIVLLSNLSSGGLLDQALLLGAHRACLKADLDPRTLIALVRSEVDKR